MRLAGTAFRIGLQIGFVCLVVVYWPHPQWPLAIWPDIHEALWPPRERFRTFKHVYDGEDQPLDVNSHLFLYRAIDTIGAVSFDLDQVDLAIPKNRAPHVSGPEPAGRGSVLPIPDVITPEADRFIREWLSKKKQERESALADHSVPPDHVRG